MRAAIVTEDKICHTKHRRVERMTIPRFLITSKVTYPGRTQDKICIQLKLYTHFLSHATYLLCVYY